MQLHADDLMADPTTSASAEGASNLDPVQIVRDMLDTPINGGRCKLDDTFLQCIVADDNP